MGNVASRATVEDWLQTDPDDRYELIRGALVQKPASLTDHADAQGGVLCSLGAPFQRKQGGGPGGWRFLTELDVRFGPEILRPDVCGYRAERLPRPFPRQLLTLAPDWVCEVVSPSNASRDRVEKRDTYFRGGVPHLWLLDPAEGTLEVFRRTDLSWTLVLAAHRGQRVRAEPFEVMEFMVDELLSADPYQAP